jgi:transcriptional regulator with XRE-family HTH domain
MRKAPVTESPPARRRLLGAALRRYRESSGFDLSEAARILECHRSKVSRIETGERGIRPKELHELLTEYGVTHEDQQALKAIVLAQHWGESDDDDELPESYREYLGLEQAASEITSYDPLQIPDLVRHHKRLQPLPYGRRSAFALIGETALRGLRDSELNHLTGLRQDAPWLTVRIVPALHPAAISGPATLLRFANASQLGAVYLPGPSGGIILVNQEDVLTYRKAFQQLKDAALSKPASLGHLSELALRRSDAAV